MSMPGDGTHDRGRLDELLAVAARQQAQWRWADAHDMLRHAVRMARQTGVRDTELSMLNCRRMLAETLRELGQVTPARDLVVPLLEDCRTYAGPAHPVTVRTAAVAGAILHDLGDLDAAEQLYHSLVDTRQPADGPAGRAVLLARVNLALLHRDRGNMSGALGLLCAVHAEFRRVYGTEDPDTVRISVELADLYRQCGDPGNARRVLTVAHASARAAFGAGHRLTTVVEAELKATIEPAFPSPPGDLPEMAPAPPVRHPRPDASSPRTRFVAPARPPAPNGAAATAKAAQPARTPRYARSDRPTTVERSTPVERPTTALVRRPPVQPPVAMHRHAAPRRDRSRQVRVIALTGLAVIVAAGTGAVLIGLAQRTGPPAGQDEQAVLAVANLVGSELRPGSDEPRAPAELRLNDSGDTIVVTWTDPSGGTAPAVVAVAPAGEQPTVDGALAAGNTRYELRKLDPAQDYCVVVGAYYHAGQIAPSTAACTRRQAAAPAQTTR